MLEGPRPRREVALRVVRATVERAALLGAPLHELPARLRAADAHALRHVLLPFALRIAAAGHELTESPAADHQRSAALRARLVRLLRLLLLLALQRSCAFAVRETRAGLEAAAAAPADHHRRFALRALLRRLLHLLRRRLHRAVQRGLQRLVDVAHDRHPVALAARHFVQLRLHLRREVDVEEAAEVLDEQVVYGLSEVGWPQHSLLALDVAAVLDRRERRRVGARPADAFLLHLLHQRGLRVPWWRLGEVLVGEQLAQGHSVRLGQLRQRVRAELLFRVVIAGFRVNLAEAGELQLCVRRPQQVRLSVRGRGGVDLDRRHVELRVCHLARDEALPDQRVKARLIRGQQAAHLVRAAPGGRRADSFVRFLRALHLARERPWLLRHKLLSIALRYVSSHLRARRRSDVYGVGSHIRDEAGLATVAQLHTLVKLLRDRHRAFRGEAQAARGLLLQRARDERRRRPSHLLLLLYLRHGVRSATQISQQPLGRRLVADLDLVFTVRVPSKLGAEGGQRAGPLQLRLDRPVLLWHERFDLPLALNDKPHRDRLHAPGGETAPHLAP